VTAASDNVFPKLKFAEGTAWATPASGFGVEYVKTDGLLYFKNDAGTEYDLTGTGSGANIVVFDEGVNKGTATAGINVTGYGLSGTVTSGTAILALAGGTAFPGSPGTAERYFRTDLGMDFYYDGTRWLSTQVLTIRTSAYVAATAGGNATGDLRINQASTGEGGRHQAPGAEGASDIYLVRHRVVFQVQGGGSALSASHKWVGTLVGYDASVGATGTVATTTIDSGSSSVFRESTVSIGAARVANTLFYILTWTKTGTPGDLVADSVLSYRIIAT
jgi:hypothetical protein